MLIIFVVVAIFYGFFVCLKKTCKGKSFWGKVPKVIVKKLTPYAISMTFELTVMELILAFTMNILYFQLNDVLGYSSLIVMVVVAVAILASFFWKIEDD